MAVAFASTYSLSGERKSGQGSWTTAVQSFYATTVGLNDYGTVLVAAGLASLVLSLASVWLARQVVHGALDSSWEDHLARAAMVIAGLGGAIALVTIIGGLVSVP